MVTTVTRSTSPFLHARMLSAPMHINAVGAISPDRAELAPDVYEVARAVVADTVDDARRLSTEIPDTIDVTPLCDVARSGPTNDQGITVFKAMGIGLADVALGRIVLEVALSKDLGRSFEAPTKTAPRLFGGTS
jgi:ornithine cyclodeaminase